MNKKGFTLIELLAVIIILTIIALIAVPTVIKLIDKTKDESLVISAEGYVQGINNCIASKMISNENVVFNSVNELNVKCSNFIKGNVPDGGNVTISDETVIAYNLIFGEKIINQNGKISSTMSVGAIIYFNPVEGEICDDYVAANSLNENKTGCMKWYLINDNGQNIDLLLDHSTTLEIAWVTAEDYTSAKNDGQTYTTSKNDLGPLTLLLQLHSDTDAWLGVQERNDTYVDPVVGYEIDYTGYRARLIEANEIAEITGADKALGWNSATSGDWYYLDGKYGADNTWQTQIGTSQQKSKYAWLYDYTWKCMRKGCNIEDNNANYGYWTSSAVNDISNIPVWRVSDNIYYGTVYDSYHDLRPVITIPKPE